MANNKKDNQEINEDPMQPSEEVVKRVESVMGPPPDEISENQAIEPEAAPSDTNEVIAKVNEELKASIPAEDKTIDEAVDDIVVKEGDEVLAAEDEKLATAFSVKKPGWRTKAKDFFSNIWNTPKYRRTLIIGLVVFIAAVLIVPPSRYFALNTAGVRAAASVKVLDEGTQQPLKNVQVSLGGQTSITDSEGVARLDKLKLGPTQLNIERRAFAPVSRPVTVGWGSNPLGDFRLGAVGSRYSFRVTDFLSNKPIAKVEAILGDASAFSDEKGIVVLTVDKTDESDLEVSLKSADYREEKLKISANVAEETAVKMVPVRRQVFVSKRSGKFDVFKVDVDGNNEERILEASGSEVQDRLAILQHPQKDVVAVVSTRDPAARNKDGYLLSVLNVIDLKTNETELLGKSERIQLLDWIDNRLVYVRVAEGASQGNPKRQRLMSYDAVAGEEKELVAANFFNDLIIVKGAIYYAPSSYASGTPGLYRVNPDGSDKRTVHDKEAWNVFRTDYDKLSYFTAKQEWYDYQISSAKSTKAAGAPAIQRSRIYKDSPDASRSLWVDERDGKGVLIEYKPSDKSEKILLTRSGIVPPFHWLNDNYIVFRISTPGETADYVLNLDGGEARKIKDVTNISSTDQWYYY